MRSIDNLTHQVHPADAEVVPMPQGQPALPTDLTAFTQVQSLGGGSESTYRIQDGNVHLVDAGANFLFRAKGAARREDPDAASEIDSL